MSCVSGSSALTMTYGFFQSSAQHDRNGCQNVGRSKAYKIVSNRVPFFFAPLSGRILYDVLQLLCIVDVVSVLYEWLPEFCIAQVGRMRTDLHILKIWQ